MKRFFREEIGRGDVRRPTARGAGAGRLARGPRPSLRAGRRRFGLASFPLWVYTGITREAATMQKTQPGRPGAKETRISVRIKPTQKALIARAARLRNATLTEFVLENALHA